MTLRVCRAVVGDQFGDIARYQSSSSLETVVSAVIRRG